MLIFQICSVQKPSLIFVNAETFFFTFTRSRYIIKFYIKFILISRNKEIYINIYLRLTVNKIIFTTQP